MKGEVSGQRERGEGEGREGGGGAGSEEAERNGQKERGREWAVRGEGVVREKGERELADRRWKGVCSTGRRGGTGRSQ